jgi:hypothetical protein
VLETALHNPNCAGVRVNSAKSEDSILIDRVTAARLLHAGGAPSRPRWGWRAFLAISAIVLAFVLYSLVNLEK